MPKGKEVFSLAGVFFLTEFFFFLMESPLQIKLGVKNGDVYSNKKEM